MEKEAVKLAIKEVMKDGIVEMKAEVSADIKAEVKEFMKTLKDGAGAGHKDVVEARKIANSSLKRFARALLDNDVATLKEMSTDATGTPFAGYVVDSELSAEIRALQTTYGVARQEMTTIALSKNSYKANELVTDVSVFWTAEGSVVLSSQVVLGQETLELAKMGAIATITRELLEDEEVDLFGFIAVRVAQKFSQKEDEAFFTGEGSGDTANNEFTGVLNVVGAGEVTLVGDAFTNITADKLLDMQDQAPQAVAKNGKYYMHRSIRNLVAKLKDSQGAYIYQQPNGGQPALLWGRPVVEVEAMPSVADSAEDTAFVVFGDLKTACILGYKGAVTADRFNAGVVRNVANNADINLITTDREAVRFIERVGYITIIAEAIVVLKTEAGS